MGRAELRAEIARQTQGHVRAQPLVSVDLFFDGNDDLASMGCNLSAHPGIDAFAGVFRELERDPRVRLVRIAISEDMGPDEWPFADAAFIVTTMGAAELTARLSELQPEPISEAREDDRARVGVELQPDEKLFMAWWD